MKATKLLCFLLAFAGLVSTCRSAPPNFLFVFIDDSGWGDLSCYGNPVKDKSGKPITPNLDRLASQGIRFTQGYVAAPICSPSRTGVLTGMEPARYAIYSFLDNRAANASRSMANWVQSDTVTSARLFQKAGYRTGQFGKWHMGNGRDVNDAPPPSQYGFDESLVAFEGNGNRLLYLNDDGTKYSLSQQNEDATVGTYEYIHWYEAAPRQTDAALKFITNSVQAGKPFYVHVPYNDTHSPYNVPPGQENDFDHITSDTTGKLFLGELHNLDTQIGRLVAGVDALGAGSNTLVVIVGDNGAPNDSLETLLNRNGGLRGGKGNIYEGGIREPFIIRWPGTVPEGRVNNTTAVSTFDLIRTYASFAGLNLPNAPFAGEDMSDVFRGATRARVKPLFWEYGTVSGLAPASPKLAVRSGNYKFMRNPDGTKREFYLIPQDHAEANNLVTDPSYASVVSSLEQQLMKWYDEAVLGNVGDTYPCSSTNFIGVVVADAYTVSGGNSPGTGFGAGSGVNYQFSSRATGAAVPQLFGYRLGGTGGTSPRQPSDFYIANNYLTIASRIDGNGRFEFSPDGISPFDFGGYLAGRNYECSVQIDVDLIGTGSQRISLGISDTSNAAVGDVDLGLQIGTDSAGGLAVFKRLDAGSNSKGTDQNVKLLGGLPYGAVNLKMRVTDYNLNSADYNSNYEILVNDAVIDAGTFRFNGSTTSRFIIFDVAAHVVPVWYDNFELKVTGGDSSGALCRKPVLSVAEVQPGNPIETRIFWSVQPGVTVLPQYSTNMAQWWSFRDAFNNPLLITTPHGSFQWLNVPVPSNAAQRTFFRLEKQ